MIAADTSVWIDYSKGNETKASLAFEKALGQGNLVIPPLVLVEVLSGPKMNATVESLILAIPRLDLTLGYWERTALMRRSILAQGLKARLGDCLIAQSCIDQDTYLITNDTDFRHFQKFGLKTYP